ncbi:hypothetical protein [Alloactinosynnema sp. L-07]|uniref:hypothetical protein n=1 Tax=Alloactinosynnema sp. L-07 TaxID=1653480 RepID=UPI00065EF7E8|nr:hypothetical protein [Alloactinosynnema sp. L-07]CRK57059.1 hypothetical protein [Alloactinosynnema sp. L-07]
MPAMASCALASLRRATHSDSTGWTPSSTSTVAPYVRALAAHAPCHRRPQLDHLRWVGNAYTTLADYDPHMRAHDGTGRDGDQTHSAIRALAVHPIGELVFDSCRDHDTAANDHTQRLQY